VIFSFRWPHSLPLPITPNTPWWLSECIPRSPVFFLFLYFPNIRFSYFYIFIFSYFTILLFFHGRIQYALSPPPVLLYILATDTITSIKSGCRLWIKCGCCLWEWWITNAIFGTYTRYFITGKNRAILEVKPRYFSGRSSPFFCVISPSKECCFSIKKTSFLP
jgi:hypothetical protein